MKRRKRPSPRRSAAKVPTRAAGLRRIGASAGICTALVALTPSPAGSHAIAKPDGFVYDDGTVTYRPWNTEYFGVQVVQAVAQVDRSELAAGTTDGNSYDVVVYDDNYNNPSWYGVYQCQQYGAYGSYCLWGHVLLDNADPPGGSWSTTERASLACEEVAHGVGVDHHFNQASCMSQAWDQTALSDHDLTVINDRYTTK
jgi:hypothetical protein